MSRSARSRSSRVEETDGTPWNVGGQGSLLDAFGRGERTGLGGRTGGIVEPQQQQRPPYNLTPSQQSPAAPFHQAPPTTGGNRYLHDQQHGYFNPQSPAAGSFEQPSVYDDPLPPQSSARQFSSAMAPPPPLAQQSYVPPPVPPPPPPSGLSAAQLLDHFESVQRGQREYDYPAGSSDATGLEGTLRELNAQTEWSQVPPTPQQQRSSFDSQSPSVSDAAGARGEGALAFDPNMFGDNSKAGQKGKKKKVAGYMKPPTVSQNRAPASNHARKGVPPVSSNTPRLRRQNGAPGPRHVGPSSARVDLVASPPEGRRPVHQPDFHRNGEGAFGGGGGGVPVGFYDEPPSLATYRNPYDPDEDEVPMNRTGGGGDRDAKGLTGGMQMGDEERNAIEELFATDDFTERFNAAAEAKSRELTKTGPGGVPPSATGGFGGPKRGVAVGNFNIGPSGGGDPYPGTSTALPPIAGAFGGGGGGGVPPSTNPKVNTNGTGPAHEPQVCHMCHRKLNKDSDVAGYVAQPFNPSAPTARRVGGKPVHTSPVRSRYSQR